MAPGSDERHPQPPPHTGTVPKTKVRNCVVPQEAVTPTRREINSANLASNSLDWASVPASEYNPRPNHQQSSRKTTNSRPDHDYSDLDGSISLESALQRFVPVRPQPRGLPLGMQAGEHADDSLHTYQQANANGGSPHANHAAAAVMIVNPTTPNTITGNTHPYNAPSNPNRNNLNHSVQSRNTEVSRSNQSLSSQHYPSRGPAKANNINNVYEQPSSHRAEVNHINGCISGGPGDNARALGEALVTSCPDQASVERRLGQIREYIRVTSSLVDTMRNSEDEAYIEHTKEEYDELVEMVMKLKESEDKLVRLLVGEPENNEMLPDSEGRIAKDRPSSTNPFIDSNQEEEHSDAIEVVENISPFSESVCISSEPQTTGDDKLATNTEIKVTLFKKMTNIENEVFNKSNEKLNHPEHCYPDIVSAPLMIIEDGKVNAQNLEVNNAEVDDTDKTHAREIEFNETADSKEDIKFQNDNNPNEILKKNIASCNETLAAIEAIKTLKFYEQEASARPVSVQSTGSGYSENELWQTELKAKMEVSQKRLAALQDQQKRLLKYQAEAKQHLADIQSLSQSRQARDNHHGAQTADTQHAQNHPYASGQHSHRMYNSNQIGVATTLSHNMHTAGESDRYRSSLSAEPDSTSHGHNQEDAFSVRSSATMPHVSDGRCSEEDDSSRARARDSETRWRGGGGGGAKGTAARVTYSSDDSGSEEDADSNKGIKSDANINPLKNDDPFKLMEIAAIKAALQKTKDLMRTVQGYDPPDSRVNEDFQIPNSNINDNKSEGGHSMGDWSTEGSVCRSIRNAIQPGKVNNHPTQGGGGSGSHEASITSLQMLASQLRQEAENIAGERQRLQEARNRADGGSGKVSKKKLLRSGSGSSATRSSPGPLERKQMALRAELADKQRQLEAMLQKENELLGNEVQKMKAESCGYSAMNQSYNSDQEEDCSNTDEVMFGTHTNSQSDHHHYQNVEGVYETSHLQSTSVNGPASGQTYYNESDTSRSKGDSRTQHPRRNRSTLAERPMHEHQVATTAGNAHSDLPPPPPHPLHHTAPGGSNSSSPSLPPPMPPPLAQPAWSSKSNQEPRWVSAHSSQAQSIERMLGSPAQLPTSLPFNMMMPYGVMGGAGCGCWGPWCWQQLASQQREMHELRQQINNLEERWRAEGSSHTLNNQVPPGNRANNYWDNFRSYSRQNLLSANSKTNADGHLGSVPVHSPHPLVSRSHNALNPAPTLSPLASAPAPPAYTPPANTPKRNTNRHKLAHEHIGSAPDVLNINQHVDTDHTNRDNVPERNINRPEPIPEIIQSHSNNLNRSPESLNTKKKSSSKLPAKNSANRRNYSLDFVQNTNINIAGTSQTPNPNLASTSRDKATSKMFDLLRENVYSEVTALISAHENHPDFLIQLFRELQNVSSDSLRQSALQSIRNLSTGESNSHGANASASQTHEESSSNQANVNSLDGTSVVYKNIIDFMIARGEEVCTPDLLEAFKTIIIDSHAHASQTMPFTPKRLQEFLSKYEGMRLREVSSDIIDDLLTAPTDERSSRDGPLQDMAGCVGGDPAGAWDAGEGEGGGRLDLIECVDVYKGDLAEADQTCGGEAEPAHEGAELLPDVVETEEITPTEAEAEWLGLDRVPTRLHTQDTPGNQKD